MPTETVQAEWVRDQVFLLRDRGGFPLVMTQPGGVNGADLLPLSLIGCVLWDIQSILEKQRQQVTALAATAVSERDDEPPWRFRRISIHYRIAGREISQEAVRRAVALSEGRYCSTFATLNRAVEIASDTSIEDLTAVAGETWKNDPARPSPHKHIILRFHDALNAGDPAAMMACMAPDCVFENTFPAPDGARLVGQAAVGAFWQDFFKASRSPHFEIEEFLDLGERCVLRWVYTWREPDGSPGRVRGADLYRLRKGLIAEKLSYVKG